MTDQPPDLTPETLHETDGVSSVMGPAPDGAPSGKTLPTKNQGNNSKTVSSEKSSDAREDTLPPGLYERLTTRVHTPIGTQPIICFTFQLETIADTLNTHEDSERDDTDSVFIQTKTKALHRELARLANMPNAAIGICTSQVILPFPIYSVDMVKYKW